MTIRDIVVSLGFEVDESGLAQVDAVVNQIKQNLGQTEQPANSLVKNIKEFVQNLKASSEDTDKINDKTNSLAERVKKFAENFKNGNKEIDSANKGVKNLTNSFSKMGSVVKKVLGVIGIGLSVKQLVAICEQYRSINLSLKQATDEIEDQVGLQNEIMEAAAATGSSYSSTVTAVSKYLTQSKKVLKTQEEALNFTTLTDKAWKSCGRSESTIASLHSTLSKAFQKNVIDASTFSTLLSQAPETIDYMCEALGKTRTQLQSMANGGVLYASYLTESITASANKINEAYEETGMTISEALQVAKGRFSLLIAQADEELEITKTLAKEINEFSKKVTAFLQKAIDFGKKVIEKLGGAENVLKLIKIVIGIILGFKLYKKLIKVVAIVKKVVTLVKSFVVALKGAGMLGTVIKAIAKGFGLVALKVTAIVGAIILLILLIQDFYVFMKGGDSVIGKALEKAGVDVDEFRKNTQETFDTFKDLWTTIKNMFSGSDGEGSKKFVDFLATTVELVALLLSGIVNLLDKLHEFGEWCAENANMFEWLADAGKKIKNFFTGGSEDSTEEEADDSESTGEAKSEKKSSGKSTGSTKKKSENSGSKKTSDSKEEKPGIIKRAWNKVKGWFSDDDTGTTNTSSDNKAVVQGLANTSTEAQKKQLNNTANLATNNIDNKTVTQNNTWNNTFNGNVDSDLVNSVDKQTTTAKNELATGLAYKR